MRGRIRTWHDQFGSCRRLQRILPFEPAHGHVLGGRGYARMPHADSCGVSVGLPHLAETAGSQHQGGNQMAVINGTSGADSLNGTASADEMSGFEGNDTL